jgi:hypothetical protein
VLKMWRNPSTLMIIENSLEVHKEKQNYQ